MSTTRRDFLKSLGCSTLLPLAPGVPAFLARAALAAEGRAVTDGNVLVVVQLAGGNDGLNTVVPYTDDEYAKARSTLRIGAGEVLKIDSLLGFHPRMPGFLRLLKDGHLSVVQGVGYPNPHQGHAESMHIWHTAMPGEASSCQTGWIGRAADRACRPEDAGVPAMFVGEIPPPFALHAEHAIVPAIRSLDQCMLRGVSGPEGPDMHRGRLTEAAKMPRPGEGNPMLDFVRRGTLAACGSQAKIEAAARELDSGRAAEYPRFSLARMLRIVAQLIRADVGPRIFFTELGGAEPGGFDNHANQRDNHAALLEQLSASVAAFMADLRRDKLLDRVLLVTFSEFGRTVRENGRRGTDHGSAAPMFLAGGRVRGGLVGDHPKLTDLESGGQRFHTDFRRVYATVLDGWLGLDSQLVLGQRFAPLELFR